METETAIITSSPLEHLGPFDENIVKPAKKRAFERSSEQSVQNTDDDAERSRLGMIADVKRCQQFKILSTVGRQNNIEKSDK